MSPIWLQFRRFATSSVEGSLVFLVIGGAYVILTMTCANVRWTDGDDSGDRGKRGLSGVGCSRMKWKLGLNPSSSQIVVVSSAYSASNSGYSVGW